MLRSFPRSFYSSDPGKETLNINERTLPEPSLQHIRCACESPKIQLYFDNNGLSKGSFRSVRPLAAIEQDFSWYHHNDVSCYCDSWGVRFFTYSNRQFLHYQSTPQSQDADTLNPCFARPTTQHQMHNNSLELSSGYYYGTIAVFQFILLFTRGITWA